jgi:alpha-beta hydrolase superfamily lysophospholipase
MRFVLYGGFYHEVLNEVEQARVIEEIVRWVEEHLSKA